MKVKHSRVSLIAPAFLGAVIALGGSLRAAEPVRPFTSMIPNNIFSATNPRPTRGGRDTIVIQRPQIERIPAPVLTGVVIDEKEYVAFLEERGRVTLARLNQKIPQGTITDITLFGITLNPADGSAPRKISLGQNIAPDTVIERTVPVTVPAGTPETGAVPLAPLETPRTVETPKAEEAPTGPVDPVIEAMKAKRLAEMGESATKPSN